MRVILVGPRNRRDRLKPVLRDAGADVLSEVDTLDEARLLPEAVDAYVVAATDEPSAAREGADVEPLTTRERDVLRLLADGLSNKAIAARLGISDQTVKFHVAAIVSKLGVANRTAAVRLAIRRGLVDI